MDIQELIELLPQILDEVDIDEAMNRRLDYEFNKSYVELVDEIERLNIENADLYDQVSAECEKYADRAFYITEHLCNNPEFAGIVSEDFVLIYLAQVYQYSNDFLDIIVNSYDEGIFPYEL